MNKRNHCLALFALSILAVVTLTCSPSENGTEKKTATVPTRTRAPAPSPESTDSDRPPSKSQPTSTPVEETVVLTGLKNELYFGGSGGPGDACLDPPESGFGPYVCLNPPGTDSPAAWVSTGPAWQAGPEALCLLGFPLDERISVDVYAPNGDYVGSGTFRVEDDPHGFTLVQAAMCWPPASLLGFPIGKWQAVVHSTAGDTTAPFEVGPQERLRTVGVEHDRFFGPFSYRRIFSVGEQAVIWGTNFAPNADLVLGIYHGVEPAGMSTRSVLVNDTTVTTDSQGDFQTSILIEQSNPCGSYMVTVVTDPSSEYSCDPDSGECRFQGVRDWFEVSCP